MNREFKYKCRPLLDKDPWNIRPIGEASIIVTKFLMNTKITANQVSWFYLILGVIAIIPIAFGNYLYTILGLILFQIATIGDGVDGGLARVRDKTSMSGSYIDTFTHRVHYFVMFICVSLGVYNTTVNIPFITFPLLEGYHNIIYLIIGLISLLSMVLKDVMHLKKYDILINEGLEHRLQRAKQEQTVDRKMWKESLYSWVRPVSTFNIIFFTAIFNVMYLTLILYVVLYPLFLIKTIKDIYMKLNVIDKELRMEWIE